jgi:hypothetical protein
MLRLQIRAILTRMSDTMTGHALLRRMLDHAERFLSGTSRYMADAKDWEELSAARALLDGFTSTDVLDLRMAADVLEADERAAHARALRGTAARIEALLPD